MTGLDPTHDRILEVAAVGTDWDLNRLCEWTGVVKVNEDLLCKRMTGKFWTDHSEVRKQLIEQNKTGKPTSEVEAELLKWLDKNFVKTAITTDPTYKGKIILAGNSIYNDRKFIDHEWPNLAARLHYRMLDVSAWKVFFQAHGIFHKKREAHRALDDIIGSIEELQCYTKELKFAPINPEEHEK